MDRGQGGGDPAAIVRQLRAALARIDPDLPLSDIQTMRERTSKSLVPQRLALTLATMFGGVALFLSMLGIYGVLNNAVAHRTREFGIRMALGSTVSGIFQLVIREGVILIGAGVMFGLAAARVASDALEGQLFGVTPGDPPDRGNGGAGGWLRGAPRVPRPGAARDARRTSRSDVRPVTTTSMPV